MLTGLVFAALIVPVFAFRHWVRDGGQFPASMTESGGATVRRAGARPYLVLAGGVLAVLVGLWLRG